MLRDRNIVCLSSIDWDFLWQGHQEIMASLAEAGNRVLFVESTGVRAPTVRDLPRLWRRLQTAWSPERPHASSTRRRRPDNVRVYSPVVLPFPYSRTAQALNRPILQRAIQRATVDWMRARPIVWNFLPTPLSRTLARSLNPALSVFHCVDHLSASSPAAVRLQETETACFAEADLVFVTSQALLDRAAPLNPHSHLVPSGVDFPRFDRSRVAHEPLPADLAGLPRPVIGYLGGLHQWVDQALLAALATRRPDWSLVLVGPLQAEASTLTRLPNVHALGTRGPEEVPRYLRGFDVATIPYRLTSYTEHVYPAKLNEYLAMGLGVVATPLAEIRRFNQTHGPVIHVAADAAAFERAITMELAGSPPEVIGRRVALAKSNSWASRLDAMSSLIDAALARKTDPEACAASPAR
ncbi:MAG: glycosyltransferase [Acidobacteria bacterium]|nr:glycosyltransferase [Acidobacteriota bacterium]